MVAACNFRAVLVHWHLWGIGEVCGRKSCESEPRQGQTWTRPTPSCDEGGASACRKGRGAQSEPPEGLAGTTTTARPSLNVRIKCHRHPRGGLVILACVKSGSPRLLAEAETGGKSWREVEAFMALGESAANRQGLQTGSLHMVVLPATLTGPVSVLKTLARPTKGPSYEP